MLVLINCLVFKVGAEDLYVNDIDENASGAQTWDNVYIASDSGEATLNISGSGVSVTSNNEFEVGEVGTGTLNIESAGVAISKNFTAASETGSSGTVSISGTGSGLSVSNTSNIGLASTGSLTVSKNGDFTTKNLTLAGESSGEGTVLVEGSNSSLSVTGTTQIGTDQATNSSSLAVQQGATATFGGDIMVTGSSTVTFQESGTTGLALEDITIGGAVLSSQLNVEGGAKLTVDSDLDIQKSSIATISGSDSDGVASSVNVAGTTTVGAANTGTLNIKGGASFTSVDLSLGNVNDVDTNGVIAVSGENSLLTVTGTTHLAPQGGGSLRISGGGAVNAQSITMSRHESGGGSLINVSGTGSSLTADTIKLAQGGTASITVEDGATATINEIQMGINSNGDGTFILSGSGSELTVSTLQIGDNGKGTFAISESASLTTDGPIIIGGSSGSNGRFVFGGADIDKPLAPVQLADDTVFQVKEGKSVIRFNHTSDFFLFDYEIDTSHTPILQSLAGTTYISKDYDNSMNFQVNGGTLVIDAIITNGNTVVDQTGTLDATLEINSEEVSLASQNIIIGQNAAGTFNISGGTSVSANNLTVGEHSGSQGTLAISGEDTELTLSNSVVIGRNGDASVTLSNSGVLNQTNGTITISENTGSNGILNFGASSGSSAAASGTLLADKISFGSNANGKIIFNHTAPTDEAFVFSPDITGAGTISVEAGNTQVTGNWGKNVITTIKPNSGDGGVWLFANGTASGVFQVSNGGYLGGSGTIGTASFAAGSQVAPGDDFNTRGKLTITGDMTLGDSDGGAVYNVHIIGTGGSDFISVGGTANFSDSSSVVLFANQSQPYAKTTSYDILQAGALPATISTVTNGNYPSYLVPALSQTSTVLTLTVANTQASVASVAQTANQYQVAKAVDALRLQSLDEQLAAAEAGASVGELIATYSPVYSGMMFLDPADTRQALDLLGGDVYASITSVMLEDSRFLRDAVWAQEATDEGRYSWAQGFGSWAEWDGSSNAAAFSRNTGGFFSGVDGQVAERLRVGLLAGYSYASYDVSRRNSSANTNSLHLGSYGKLQADWAELQLGAAYSLAFVDAERTVAYGDFYDDPDGNYTTSTFQLFGQVSHSFETPLAKLTPFVGGAFVAQTATSFQENGEEAQLLVSPDTETVYFSNLGGRVHKEFQISGYTAALNLGASWQHLFGNNTAKSHSILQSQDYVSTVKGISLSRDTALVAAGLSLELTDNIRASLAYDGLFSENTTDNGLNGAIRIRF
ncbi:autotransporter domain-containing protein [Flexibacterium corallicola]|uniref:autotransporter domain-containing protein n=1 Tax=Flexibacterium corallicola TaxID=3037259 RepID=UPI00286F5946|nr:autotransporter domain-containing protein [Pseudovibrio sp. M1P-2-3]